MDQQLGLTLWPPPGRTRPVGLPPRLELEASLDAGDVLLRRPTGDDEDGPAPSWWHGDEEASQAFLKAEGIQLE